MLRKQKLLYEIDLEIARGIEIGALDKPVVPPETQNIFYVDHVSTPNLKAKYKDHAGVDIDRIVNVSGVWGEQSLAEVSREFAPVNYVVASHVIEHVPDLIGWLNELASVLEDQGQVRLAIPDKRYTFDIKRADSALADVIAAYLTRARVPTVRAVLDHLLNVADVDAGAVWSGLSSAASVENLHDSDTAINVAKDVRDNANYHDVHCWVFSPLSFFILMGKLAEMGFHKFRCATFHDTEPGTIEFFVSLELCDDQFRVSASWKAMADRCLQAAYIEKRQKESQLVAEHGKKLEVVHAQTLDAIYNSNSWKITKPLRSVAEFLRALI